MEKSLTPTHNNPLAMAGKAANDAAARNVFADYRSRKAANTLRRQDADLALFGEYLKSAGIQPGDFGGDPHAWQGITWGLVEGFVKWQLIEGYAVASVGVRLSTVKTYAQLATKAGAIEPTEYAMIRTVAGYSRKEGKRIDERRAAEGMQLRVSPKKSNPTPLTNQQADELLQQPFTPKGRRDALMLCLMIEHGLRVGEVANLKRENFDMRRRVFSFYREKVNKEQTHRMTDRTFTAAIAYFEIIQEGELWKRGAHRSTADLAGPGLSVRAISKRVEYLGGLIGIENLSPHDLRHYWATNAARRGTPVRNLQEAGGWSSPAMPLRYIAAEEVANDGVITQ